MKLYCRIYGKTKASEGAFILFCGAECMQQDSILMLSCCRGGLNQVAYDLFYSCKHIAYVVGPRQSLEAYDMQISYSMLLYLMVRREFDPVVACEKINAGTDIRFFFFDRLEVEAEFSYIHRCNFNNMWRQKFERDEIIQQKADNQFPEFNKLNERSGLSAA